jgi:NodT family efflux transporter outer membrane factor (OMF) lipoprotein
MKNPKNKTAAAFSAAVLPLALTLSACTSLAPAYQVPAMKLPSQFKEPSPWVDAHPKDELPRGNWWTIYGDPELSRLEAELDTGNQSLAAALAHYTAATALDHQVQAALYPTISGTASSNENEQSTNRPLYGPSPRYYGNNIMGLTGDYVIDFWGKVRSEVTASHAAAQAAAADLATAKLNLEVQLAEDYFALLGNDRDIKLLTDTVGAYEKALELTQTLHGGGLVSGLDVSRAVSQLDTARAQVFESRSNRALLEHAIAVLIGDFPSHFSLKPDLHQISLPPLPAVVPATLLERRPDIAAAERRTAAANAQIGVARAAFFPNIDLSAEIGLQSTQFGNLVSEPSLFWVVGPNLAQVIFDGGLHQAQLAQAEAQLAEAGSNYREVVLTAFQQVEDNLSLLDNSQKEWETEAEAVKAAQETLDVSLSYYKDGGLGYLDVIVAQTALLTSQRTELSLETQVLKASADLFHALGGGWQTSL